MYAIMSVGRQCNVIRRFKNPVVFYDNLKKKSQWLSLTVIKSLHNIK